MSKESIFQEFNPEIFAAEIKNYHPIANAALARMFSQSFKTNSKMSAKERIDYMFCNILNTPREYYTKTFKDLNSQNKMLLAGIFFKSLFDKYLAHLNINFDDVRMQTKMIVAVNPMVSKQEYDALPKHYRGIFMPYDSTHYVLNTNYNQASSIIVFVKQNQKKELKELLDSARKLIMVIYRTKHRESVKKFTLKELEQKWLNRTIAESVVEPAFTQRGSKFSHSINTQQIDALQKLCEIFTKIDNMTLSYERNLNAKISSNSLRIYTEYQNELTQKNRYLDAQNAINRARKETTGLQELSTRAPKTEHAGIDVLLEQAQKNYANARQRIIAAIPGRTK